MSRLETVVLIHVEHGAGDPPFTQHLYQRAFLDDRPAADVDQPCARPHRAEPLAIEQMLRLRSERAGEDHKVALAHERGELASLGLGREAIEAALIAEHAHAESLARNAREPRADVADADEAKRQFRDLVRSRP